MVSRAAGIESLDVLTGYKDIYSFHLVLLVTDQSEFHKDPPRYPDSFVVASELEKHFTKSWQGTLCYLCTTKSRLLLIKLEDIKQQDYNQTFKKLEESRMDEMKKKEEGNKEDLEGIIDSGVTYKGLLVEEATDKHSKTNKQSALIFDMELCRIKKLLLHKSLPDRFAILMDQEICKEQCGLVVLASCHRKAIIEDVQIAHNTAVMHYSNNLEFLNYEYMKALTTTGPAYDFRHPALMMFNTLPQNLKMGKEPFYRCGYLFLGPKEMQDESSIDRVHDLKNRYTATYTWKHQEDSTGVQMPKEDCKHLIVRIMPKRPIVPTSQGSNLAFHLWVERVAWAVAESETEDGDSFFVPEHGIYRKKLNIVKDEAMWHCFRLHVFTKNREIGVIGIRRKFIPPRIDTYQDMIFILKGIRQQPDKRSNEADFMLCLEQIVDSLSPTVMDWKHDTTWVLDIFGERKELQTKSHPTYVDTLMIQTQANSLICSKDVYSWLRNRPAFGTPEMTFQGQTTFSLAKHFCKSIIKTLYPNYHDTKNVTIRDPLAIITRIETAAREMLDTSRPRSHKVILLNNWKRRISVYFSYMVDTFRPSKLDLKALFRAVTDDDFLLSEDDRTMLDKVIAFLLYLHPSDGIFEQPRTSITEQLQDEELMTKFTCNEDVLTKMLETEYVEDLLERRCIKGKDKEIFSTCLQKLLVYKSQNLDLLRVVCRKCRGTQKYVIKPLIRLAQRGNTYAKTFSLQALKHIASKRGSTSARDEIFDNGGIEVAVDAIRTTPNRDLLQTSIGFLRSLLETERVHLNSGKTRILDHQSFLNKLLSLLKKQQLGQRHDSSVIAAVAKLIMNVCHNRDVVYYLVLSGVVKELVEIIGDYKNYFRILAPVTVCLAFVFVYLDKHQMGLEKLLREPTSELNESLSSQTEVIVRSLKHCTTREGLQAAANLLVVLGHILSIDKKLVETDDSKDGKEVKIGMDEKVIPGVTVKKTGILRNLVENHGFEHTLVQAKTTANNVASQVRGMHLTVPVANRWKTIISGVQRKAGELLGEITALKSLLRGEEKNARGRSART
eukprot:CAMPEP_0167767432 /NCGR_PEP_ID=MMETSP0110_2-20121227/16048_1 /TAXON_ID=629695 /ORGANISM="Gymnochlora sp., Strain CCMP2014" /LENGTH=1060 /DNA_ID=CAMNT_0007655873 /DNA_START=41 /DNA_END=3223 /DNA_ORIENTATION=-